MLTHRLSLVVLLAAACTPAQDPKQATKREALEQPAEPKPELPPQPASGPTYALAPGEAIGPIRIGMSKAEIEALGILETHPQFSAMTIPISVYYDESEKAKTVEISLTHSDEDVAIGDVVIPRTANVEQIRKLLGDCSEPEVNKGGTMHACRGGAVFIAIGSGNPDEVWLRINEQ
jgi:hypothetical protein